MKETGAPYTFYGKARSRFYINEEDLVYQAIHTWKYSSIELAEDEDGIAEEGDGDDMA